MTARGCPLSCRYCVLHGPFRVHSPEYIAKLLTETGRLTGSRPSNLVIWDDSFTLPRDRCITILDVIAQFGARFTINTRPDHFDERIAAALRKAGCEIVFFGIESSSKDTLEALGRPLPPETMTAAVSTARACGLITVGSMMIGTPYDTPESIGANVTFLRDQVQPDLCFFSPFAAHPGSGIYEDCVRDGIIPPYEDWSDAVGSDFAIIPPQNTPSASPVLSKRQIDRFVTAAYRDFYAGEKLQAIGARYLDRPFVAGMLSRIRETL